jgi:dihydrodipicolinate synthase/N-acetylneuraminate lyase
VTGISPLGSTGEGYSLDLEQRLAVVDTVARAVPAGMPVIPGLFPHNHEQAAAEIAAYAARGATGVLVAPPSYYPLRGAEVQAFFARLADATALPLVLYNIPRFTKVRIGPSVAAALAAHPRVSGLKDSSGDFGYGTELLDAVAASSPGADFSVLTGIDSLFVAYLLAGAQGTICGSANLVPELVRSVYDEVRSGKLDDALRHEAQLRAVNAACGVGALPAAYKTALTATGIGSPHLVPPRQPLTESETATLLDRLKSLGVL